MQMTAKGGAHGCWLGSDICALLNEFGLAQSLGIRLLEVSAGAARSEMTVGPSHASFTTTGQTHGGAVLSMVDHTAGAAVAGAMLLTRPVPRNESAGFDRVVAIELNANFLRLPHTGDRVEATSQVVHRGTSLLVVESSVRDVEDRLVARGRQTCLVRRARSELNSL